MNDVVYSGDSAHPIICNRYAIIRVNKGFIGKLNSPRIEFSAGHNKKRLFCYT
jgi:hypothetical protein